MPLIDIDLVQLAVLGFFTGFGTTFGTEIAKMVLAHLKKKTDEALNKEKGLKP